jgi:hypothetical protein
VSQQHTTDSADRRNQWCAGISARQALQQEIGLMRTRGIWFNGGITIAAVVLVGAAVAANASTIMANSSAIATAHPSAIPGPAALAAVDPVILGNCTAAIHDRYTVMGPDGHIYRTWHPQVVPIDPNNPSPGTCQFDHEHGDNPQTSAANPNLPPFGYIGVQVSDAEPHEGFKVFVGYPVPFAHV